MALSPQLQETLRGCNNLPSPPGVATQIIELAQDTNVELGRVARAVSSDPALAAKILRMANSAVYSRRRRSSNLRQALIVLGLDSTLTLALSFTLVGALRDDAAHGIDYPLLWRRSVLSGTWARVLAEAVGIDDADEAFLAGLLQDIGIMAIDRAFSDAYDNVGQLQADHRLLTEHEQQLLGTDHAEVGAWLLGVWNIPDSLRHAVKWSHAQDYRDPDEELHRLIRCVALSGMLADAWIQDLDQDGLRRVTDRVRRSFNVTQDALCEMFQLVRDQIPAAEDAFEMNLVDKAQGERIMMQARELLVVRNMHLLEPASDPGENYAGLSDEDVDSVTSVATRPAFDRRLDNEFNAAHHHGWPLGVLRIDLDDFGALAERIGEESSRRFLRAMGDALKTCTRDTDMVGRWCEDAFAVLLPGTSLENTLVVATRIVDHLRALEFVPEGGDPFRATMSIGAVCQRPSSSFPGRHELVSAAEQALGVAKLQGGDQVTVYDPSSGRLSA